MTELGTPSPVKVDPETLAIRSKPPRAIRFKRGVIAATAAVGSVSLLAVTWTALSPRLLQHGEVVQELSQPEAVPANEALSGAPANYGDVPRLGPPLPGDLGRPILERQEQLAAAGNPSDHQVQQAQAAARERRLAELKAARQSGLLVQDRQAEPIVGGAIAAPAPASPSDAAKIAFDPDRDPNAQWRKATFVAAVDPKADVNPHALSPSPSPYTLSAGSVISASLITGIRSDLPGLVTAQVTDNVYDSATGRLLLVPQGARLVGSYDSVVAFGQTRALIVWQRIIMPDGSSLRLDNVPATDPSGYAGLEDKVDFHARRLLEGVTLSTLLGVSSQLALSGQGDLVQALRMSSQDNVARVGDQITQRNLGVQPTLTIRPGVPVRLVVQKDLIFGPIRKDGANP